MKDGYENKKFNRLTVINKIEKDKYRFKCECGNVTIKNIYSVKSGSIKSCGCLKKEQDKKNLKRFKHGDAMTGNVKRIHNIWRDMIKRCKHHVQYKNRGIKVCDEWMEYIPFRNWAYNNGYKENLTIDRIDNDGNYEPSNCRWVCQKIQARNRRTSRLLKYNGEKKTIAEWSELTGISASLISARIDKLNWTIEQALTKKVKHPNKQGE